MAKSDVSGRLRALRDELAAINPYPWSSVEAWIAKARPLFRSSLPAHLPDFEKAAKTPPWSGGFYMSSEDPYTGEVTSNAAQEDVRVDRENAKSASNAHTKLLSYVDGLLLEEESATPSVPDAVDVVVSMLRRFDAVAKSLEKRRGEDQPVVMRNEYDVQYILGAVLGAYFDDVRAEDPVKSIAGGASRVDFVLKKERIIIEVKFATARLKDKDIGDQLIVDQRKYREHDDCGTLICFVYDPTKSIANATALERDLAQDSEPHTIVIVRR